MDAVDAYLRGRAGAHTTVATYPVLLAEAEALQADIERVLARSERLTRDLAKAIESHSDRAVV